MAERAKGQVARIYATDGQCYIRLANTGNSPNDLPKDGYFVLQMKHNNYHALYSLALVAAVNGYQLEVRAEGEDISPEHYAIVSYMVVDWNRG